MRSDCAARASNFTFSLSMPTIEPQLTQATLSMAPECTVSGEAQCGQLKARALIVTACAAAAAAVSLRLVSLSSLNVAG